MRLIWAWAFGAFGAAIGLFVGAMFGLARWQVGLVGILFVLVGMGLVSLALRQEEEARRASRGGPKPKQKPAGGAP